MNIVFIAFGLLFSLASLFVEQGMAQIVSVSLSSFFIGMSVLGFSSLLDQKFIVYKFYVIFHVLQPAFLFVYALLYPIQLQQIIVNTTLHEGRAYTLYYSFLLVPLLGLAVAFGNSLRSASFRETAISFYSKAAGRRLDFILIVSAFAALSAWFILGVPGVLGYGLRVFRAALAFTPFLAGLYFGRSILVRYVWLVVLVLGLIFSMLTGSRGYAFWPLLMYALGFLVQLRPGRQRVLGWSLFALSLPFGIFMIGFIQQLRSEMGRKPLLETEISEVASYIPTALKNTLSRGDEIYLIDEETGGSIGFSRMVDWTLLFAPNMTPNPAEYRGYGDFHQELLSMLSFGGSDLRSSIGKFYSSFMYARNYGFNVYGEADEQGLQKSHTVPFSVIADSWSRWGLISSIIQVAVLMVFLVVAEGFVRKLFRRQPEIMVMLFFFLCDTALRFATVYTVTRTVRTVIIYGTFTGVVVFGIRLVRKKLLPHLFVPRDYDSRPAQQPQIRRH